ncbi:Transforming growth factor-beta receptor-associated protein 1 [Erysiphe neolycopersici]|uniref:Transforming growth factor-beta receptor-associated protein 1 n=1 Tax=Erysiphe neolycopersici TaxID=212602 RepID=A0A420HHQ2_9PEZI|nr:Transforming growth factor-beta receptor-associated protein 1 [Erysiphe neolycopersici]
MRSRSSKKAHSVECRDGETGPYILRTLLAEIPLSTEGGDKDIHITCVEFLDQNLYIGTSAPELLHYVQIPPDSEEQASLPSYILASRIVPAFHNPQKTNWPGIQQILLLPTVNKACILCNWTVTFYSLPELSPVYGNTQVRPCNWIGGLDLNIDPKADIQENIPQSVTILVSLKKKIKLVKISESPRGLRTIDFSGSLISVRRDSYACVADERAYALLDVDRLLKIPLFAISSLIDSNSQSTAPQLNELGDNSSSGPASDVQLTNEAFSTDQGNSRRTSPHTIKSIANFTHNSSEYDAFEETQEKSSRHDSSVIETSHLNSPETQIQAPSKALPRNSSEVIKQNNSLPNSQKPLNYLKPHIASPTPQEFLLVTGIGPNDPGVGMFVNLEGDPTRSTLEFCQYPHDIVVDGRGVGVEPISTTVNSEEEGYVLASMIRNENNCGIEIQRWDLHPGHDDNEKYWLKIPPGSRSHNSPCNIGLRSVIDTGKIYLNEAVDKLSKKRFRLFETKLASDCSNSPPGFTPIPKTSESHEHGSHEDLFQTCEIQRYEEERQFSKRFGRAQSRIVVWSGNSIWWVVKNPLVLRLDASIPDMIDHIYRNNEKQTSLHSKLFNMIEILLEREAKTETEYLSLAYLRQRAGLLLFLSSLYKLNDPISESEHRIIENVLLEGGIDPRIILALIPFLQSEIDEGKSGIWIHGGIKDVIDNFVEAFVSKSLDSSEKIMTSDQTLHSIKRFLTAWRKKKGFGSIANEYEVFKSVDAGLLVVLLRLDRPMSLDSSATNSVRLELYDLVDNGIDCFERAITILESENRLYALSRLYQSRKMSNKVLKTWKRILDNKLDVRREFVDGEKKVLDYLLKIRKISLIEEYGVWLAARNSKLGVQAFTDERSQVKFEPSRVLDILRCGASSAVKDYLEYLVFQKQYTEYVNELIFYYLDIVTGKLEQSQESRSILKQSYESYRALPPPKPTYHQFITEDAIQEEWWQSRLRLLHLLGGGQDSTSKYDFKAVLERIAPYSQELVPELIILDGRQANHDKALRLLTHGLGDYDTAINYCLLGGLGIYHPISGTVTQDTVPSRDQQAKLFGVLLLEFLNIQDVSNCVQQTSNLLDRFGGWFDIEHVLRIIPDTWSVDLISGFLINALGQIVRERGETMVIKALSGAENLKVNIELIGKISSAGVSIET